MHINYAIVRTPPSYRCHECNRQGCKLWRPSMTCSDNLDLLCCDCAGKKQGKNVKDISIDGKINTDLGYTDQIGRYVPAVPTTEGDNFWGYTSVPDDGCKWWYALPTRVSMMEDEDPDFGPDSEPYSS